MKRSALVGVKLAVSAALLAYLFSTTDVRALEQRVRSADLLLLAAAVVCYVAMLALATWRWRLLLETLGFDAPLRRSRPIWWRPSSTTSCRATSAASGARARQLAPDRLDHRLAGRGGIDRILGFGALYVLAAAAFALGGSVERELAGARVVLAGPGARVPGPRLRLLPPGHRPAPAWRRRGSTAYPGCSSSSRPSRAPCARLPLAASGRVVARPRREPRAAGARGLLLLLGRAGAAHPAAGLRRFLMVPLCTLVQAVPISFNGWGLREGLFTVYFAQIGLPRESALAFWLVGAGLIVVLSLSGAVVWLAGGTPYRRRPRARDADGRPGAPRLRQVRGARVEHPRRLAPVLVVVPPLRPGALLAVARRPEAARARDRLLARAGHPGAPPRARALRPAHPRATSWHSCAHAGRRILHVHGYAAADFGRLAARATGARLVLHEHFADPRMPGYQGLADRLLRWLHPPRHRGERLDPRLPGAGSATFRRERVRVIWNGAPSTSSLRSGASAALALRRSLGLPDDAARDRHHRPPERAEGPRFLLEAAARVLNSHPEARLLMVGDGDLASELRGQAQALGIDERARVRGSPRATCPSCWA